MFVSKVSIFLTSACLVLSAEIKNKKFNINDKVDAVIPQIAELLRNKNLDRVRLPDLAEGPVPIFINVFMTNTTTLFRKGDAYMWQSGSDNTSFSIPLGFHKLRISVDLCTYMNGPFTWDIEGTTAEIGFTLYPSDGPNSCKTNYDFIRLKELGTILVQHSSNPKFDGVPPEPLVLTLIEPWYNHWFNDPEILDVVNQSLNLCESSVPLNKQ